MGGPGNIMLSEISQSKNDKYHMTTHVESNEQPKLTGKMGTDSKRTG